MRGRGTLREYRRIAERALSCKVRDTEGFEEIVAEPSDADAHGLGHRVVRRSQDGRRRDR